MQRQGSGLICLGYTENVIILSAWPVLETAKGHILGVICESISRKDRRSSEKVIPGGQPTFRQIRSEENSAACLSGFLPLSILLLPPPWESSLGPSRPLLSVWAAEASNPGPSSFSASLAYRRPLKNTLLAVSQPRTSSLLIYIHSIGSVPLENLHSYNELRANLKWTLSQKPERIAGMRVSMSEFPLQTPTSIRTERRMQTRSGANAVAFPYMPTGETLVRWRGEAPATFTAHSRQVCLGRYRTLAVEGWYPIQGSRDLK